MGFNELIIVSVFFRQDDYFAILKLSYLWYMLLGTLISLASGSLVSFLTKKKVVEESDSRLFFPFIAKHLHKVTNNATCQLNISCMFSNRKTK